MIHYGSGAALSTAGRTILAGFTARRHGELLPGQREPRAQISDGPIPPSPRPSSGTGALANEDLSCRVPNGYSL